MTWARKIWWVRTRLGFQQRQLAELLNVSPAAVCRWEKGNLVPDGGNRQLLETLYRQARAKEVEELKKIGKKILAAIAAGTAIAALILLLASLFRK